MTQQSFTFDIRYLKSCALVASTEQTRYYLNGVALQYDGKDLVAVATDGHRMVCFNIDFAKEGDPQPFSMIIPKSVIDGIKQTKIDSNVSLVLGLKDGFSVETKQKPYLQYAHNMFLFDPIDGVFPDWQRVIPTTLSHVVAQFNPKYLMDFEKISKMWSLTSKNVAAKLNDSLNSVVRGQITITHNESGPAYINLNIGETEGFGILMPIRDKSSPITHAPIWATGFKLPQKPEDVAA